MNNYQLGMATQGRAWAYARELMHDGLTSGESYGVNNNYTPRTEEEKQLDKDSTEEWNKSLRGIEVNNLHNQVTADIQTVRADRSNKSSMFSALTIIPVIVTIVGLIGYPVLAILGAIAVVVLMVMKSSKDAELKQHEDALMKTHFRLCKEEREGKDVIYKRLEAERKPVCNCHCSK